MGRLAKLSHINRFGILVANTADAASCIALACGLSICGTSHAQPPEAASLNADNAVLAERSKSLDVEGQERAHTLFSTGFQLWQAGDFAASEIAFRKGLEIDPVNAAANFYLGDALRRRRAHAESNLYFRRAIFFGGDSPEAIRAEAALSVPETPVSVAEMTPAEVRLAFAGDWQFDGGSLQGELQISLLGTNSLKITGQIGDFTFKDGTTAGSRISMRWSGGLARLFATAQVSGELVEPNRIQGTWGAPGTPGATPWTATRR